MTADTSNTSATPPGPAGASPSHAPRLGLGMLPFVNAALRHMDVPVVSGLAIENPNDHDIGPVRVRIGIDPPIAPPCEHVIQYLRPREAVVLDERHLVLDLSLERLINQIEAERGRIVVDVETPDHRYSVSEPIEIAAWNEWLGARIHPESLACFVQPNHPALVPLLQVAQRTLREATGDPSLQGYQSERPERVGQMCAALWAAAQSFRIAYINPPASFGEHGQKVLLPDAVLGDHMGTCLDLTVFLASVLERAGLHPLLVLIKGHAYPGVFLSEEAHLSAALTDDYSELAKHVEAGRALVFDSSALAHGTSFNDACGLAQVRLLDPETFHYAIDVHLCRRQRAIRPLPLRASTYAVLAEEPDRDLPPPVLDVPVLGGPRTHLDRPLSKSGPRTVAERRLQRWKSRLLDLSLRNPLLNFKFDGRRSLPLLTHSVAELEDELSSREPFALVPAEADGLRSQILIEQRTGKSVLTEQARDFLKKHMLIPDLPGAQAVKRIVDMYRMARTLAEETGQSGAWLALGFLEWFETAAAREPRYAPLILVPVQIQRGTAREPFRMRIDDDEPRINSTLLKKLEIEFRLDVAGQDEIPEDERGLDIPFVFERFRRLIADLPRCRLVERAAVGFFSFTKHMMWLDLEARSEALLDNAVVRHLVESEGRAFPAARPFIPAHELDAHRPPGHDLAVVPADSSQLVAVQSAIDGNTFVLEGPPGTGKSQTITNLVAELMGRGQSVLFVAEKRAAIEVVRDRLAQVGLGPFCLDLHAHDATKAEIIAALTEPLDMPRDLPPSELARKAAELHKLRDELAVTWRALHTSGAAGVSVWQAVARLGELADVPAIKHDFDGEAGASPLGDERWARIQEATRELAWATAAIETPVAHAFASCRLTEWTPRREATIAQAIDALEGAASKATRALDAAAERGIEARRRDGEHLHRVASFLETLREVPARAEQLLSVSGDPAARHRVMVAAEVATQRARALSELDARWRTSELMARDVEALHGKFARWAHAFFLVAFVMLFFVRRSLTPVARRPLGRSKSVAEDLARAVALRELETTLRSHAAELPLALGDLALGATGGAPDPAAIAAEAGHLQRRLAWCDGYRVAASAARTHLLNGERVEHPPAIDAALCDEIVEAARGYEAAREALVRELELDAGALTRATPLEVATGQARAWRAGLKGLRDWAGYARARREALALGLAPFVSGLEEGAFGHAQLERVLERSAMTWRIEDALSRDPMLARFRGADHEARAAAFRKLDDERQRLAREEIRTRLVQRLPDGRMEVGEVGVLRTEAKKKRRHLPLRKLFAKIPTILPRLKPCVLMSPMSVAQYLDPALSVFDVVVFDEASQIPPWDAIGALGRGRRAIVVGDSKQMPPTSFFSKTDDEDVGEDDIEEMESILDECDRSGLPKLSLKWHYRSKHPSLIQFSNARYYDSQLVTFPAAAARSPTLGVRWIPVDGIYDKGGKRDNRKEAEVVVREVVRRLEDPVLSHKTIGVVTFAMPQRDLIDELLEEERRKRPELERFFDPKQTTEPVFIKNLENVQGDERDVIIFSMSYGPDKAGKVALNFGALNRAGGERRLNVAVTRAKESLIVVSSLRPEHIGEGRTSALGVKHLREFLAFAERSGQVTSAEEVGRREADVAGFVDAIAERLAALGYRADKNIGASGPRVDLAVRDPKHPERYLLGIVTDSPVWARFPSVRDREKLGPGVLGSQGWAIHRVWSLDWWHDPERELASITAALRRAEAAGAQPPALPVVAVPAAPVVVVPAAPVVASSTSAPTPRVERARTDPMQWSASPAVPWHAVEYVRAPPVSLLERQPIEHPYFSSWVAERLAEIVEIEGPMFVDDAVRRAFDAWHVPRVGKNMARAVLEQVEMIEPGRRPRQLGEVFWPRAIDPRTWHVFRVPAEDAQEVRAADAIPHAEVMNAALAVLARALSLTEDQLVGQLMQIFGINRRGAKVVEHFKQAIAGVITAGHAQREGETLRFTGS